MSDELNEHDDVTQDPQLRDFLKWRASVGPRPRGSAVTARAIGERLDARTQRQSSSRRMAYALGGVALSVLVLGAAAFIFLRLPAQGPATQPSPTYTPAPHGACPAAPAFVPGAAFPDQLKTLWAERIEGDIGSGAVVFPTPIHPGSNGQTELWYDDGTLGNARLIASLDANDHPGTVGYDLRVAQVSRDRSAALVEIFLAVPSDDVLADCKQWFIVSTSASHPGLALVAGPDDGVMAASLSPDGTRVAFVMHAADDGVGNAHLDVRDAAGASLGSTPITTAIASQIAWAPDSDQLAVASGPWVALRMASATTWTTDWQITPVDNHPASIVWPTQSGPIVAAFALPNQAGDGFSDLTVFRLPLSGGLGETTSISNEGPWAPRAAISPDGRLLRATRFVGAQPVEVIVDLSSASPSLTNLNSQFDAQRPLVDWQWSADSSAIEQSASTDTGAQIVSVPVGGTGQPESTLVTLTTLWGSNHEWVIGRTAWVGP
jgi:hypothetical protein